MKAKHKSVDIAIGSNKVSKQVVQIIGAKAVPVKSILDETMFSLNVTLGLK